MIYYAQSLSQYQLYLNNTHTPPFITSTSTYLISTTEHIFWLFKTNNSLSNYTYELQNDIDMSIGIPGNNGSIERDYYSNSFKGRFQSKPGYMFTIRNIPTSILCDTNDGIISNIIFDTFKYFHMNITIITICFQKFFFS
jgi:hypothetical protein